MGERASANTIANEIARSNARATRRFSARPPLVYLHDLHSVRAHTPKSSARPPARPPAPRARGVHGTTPARSPALRARARTSECGLEQLERALARAHLGVRTELVRAAAGRGDWEQKSITRCYLFVSERREGESAEANSQRTGPCATIRDTRQNRNDRRNQHTPPGGRRA